MDSSWGADDVVPLPDAIAAARGDGRNEGIDVGWVVAGVYRARDVSSPGVGDPEIAAEVITVKVAVRILLGFGALEDAVSGGALRNWRWKNLRGSE